MQTSEGGRVFSMDCEAHSPKLLRVGQLSGLGNFGGKSLAAVGIYSGLGPYGTYDMAGNAKEWCWNSGGKDKAVCIGRSLE
jgi:formylglycine-generating enzyme required for sulfatase activity